MAKMNVLITGMSGLIGGVVKEQLADKYELSALNRSGVAGVKCYQADISDLDAIRPAFTGQDVVVHLAAKAFIPLPYVILTSTPNVSSESPQLPQRGE